MTDTAAVMHLGFFDEITSHLVHFLQTFISDFQPINDLRLDLGKLQVLDLKNTQRRWSEQQK